MNVAGIEVEPGRRETRVVDVPVGERTVPVPIIAVNGAAGRANSAIRLRCSITDES